MYILQIIFDKTEQELSFSQGLNPKFTFDVMIEKEINYSALEDTYMEINLYSHELVENIKNFQ